MNESARAVVLSVLVAACSCSAVAAVTSTGTWNFEGTAANTSPGAAADWFSPGNWTGGMVASGREWNADFTGSTALRYIRIDRPIVLGALSATRFPPGSLDGVRIISDDPITIDNPDSRYSLYGGSIFADVATSDADREEGVMGTVEINGRIRIGNQLTLASNSLYHRLDHYATGPEETRTDDFSANLIYRGSGSCVMVGPRAGIAHVGEWTVTAGSSIVTRSATAPVIAPGAAVSCGTVFPEGTYVKRVYSDTEIELSAAASGSAESGVMELAFAAFNPVARVTVPELKMVSAEMSYTSFVKFDAGLDFRVDVMKLTTNGSSAPFNPNAKCLDGSLPATVVVHDAAQASSAHVVFQMGDCHVEFAETGREGARSGIPHGTAVTYENGSGYVTRLTVTNGIDAAIGLVYNLSHTLVKDGAGSLELGLTNSVSRNTGTIVVKEGAVVLPEGSWVKTLAVSNGATIVVNGVFSPNNLIVEEGARVDGTGTVVLPDVSYLDKLVLSDTVAVRIAGGSGEFMREPPAASVPGNPAFWVDASQTNSMTFEPGTLQIRRVNDVRSVSGDGGFLFATNVVLCPTLATNGNGNANHINFGSRKSSATKIEDVAELVWSEPVTNIHVIFMAQDVSLGGGQFLGSSGRLRGIVGRQSDFVRDASSTWKGTVFHVPNANDYRLALLNGPFYQNGRRCDPRNGYAYPGGKSCFGKMDVSKEGIGDFRWSPLVAESFPLMPVAADAFCYDDNLPNRNGNKRLCELIIYTNAVSRAEQIAVRRYLMEKWLDCQVVYDAYAGEPVESVEIGGERHFNLAVEAGEVVRIGSVDGSGTFSKRGEGEAHLGSFVNSAASLAVDCGVVEVVSRRTATRDELPPGVVIHMDASEIDSIELEEIDGEKFVDKWTSVRDGTFNLYNLGDNRPKLREDRLNGLAMVDFGKTVAKSSSVTSADPHCYLRANRREIDLRSIFMVADTSQGGCMVLGESKSWSYGGLMRAGRCVNNEPTYSANPADPLVGSTGNPHDASLSQRYGSRTFLNGNAINPGADGYSGGCDLLSMVSYVALNSSALAYNQGHGSYSGGAMVGEYIVYNRGLSEDEARVVEAYLNRKWFNRDTYGFVPAAVGDLSVAEGATLRLTGGAPMTVNGTLSGGGTVEGSLRLAQDAVIEIPVDGDAVRTLTVGDDLEFAGAGTVRLAGDARKLLGEYVLLDASGLTSADLAGWSLEFAGARRRGATYSLTVVDGALVLRVAQTGTYIFVR